MHRWPGPHVVLRRRDGQRAGRILGLTPDRPAASPGRRPATSYTPGGFELFFEDFGNRLRRGPVGLDELNSLGEPHGIRFFDDWIPELKPTYDLCVIGE